MKKKISYLTILILVIGLAVALCGCHSGCGSTEDMPCVLGLDK